MQPQLQNQKEQAQAQLGLIKQALDAAVKGSVIENLDTAYAITTAFYSISNIVQQSFEKKDEQPAN